MIKRIIAILRTYTWVYYTKYIKLNLFNLSGKIHYTFNKNNIIKDFEKFEQSKHSQNGEDGILKIIFYKIKTTNKFCVEFGIHPLQGNTIYLKQMGWNCLWMDGDGDGKEIKNERITAENINQLFQKYNVPKEFDLLSIDIDSNDYWVWKSINDYSPRVIVIEYNSCLPKNESKTVVYDPNLTWDGSTYFGASLLALYKLGLEKGYTLLTCDSKGVNAFFVRNDLIRNHFEIRSVEEIYRKPQFGGKLNGEYFGYHQGDRKMIDV